jgi:DNA-binding transcriptional LysR family regulator
MSYRECLHTFLSVYRLGSQNKAAEALALTQPAISQHLKMLEHYVGKPLFTREGRGLKPTAVAHQLALNITDAVDTITDVLDSIKKGDQRIQGEIYIGGLSGFFAKVVVPLLPTLAEYDIHIRFEIDHTTLLPRLLNNELHIGQFTENVVHPQLTMEKLFHQRFVLVGHPKFKRDINQKQLDKSNTQCLTHLPWIAYNETLLFIKEYYQSVFQQEFNGKIKLLISDVWANLAAARAGIGVTVLPAYFCQELFESKEIEILYQTQKAPSHFFYIGWKQGALRDPKIKLIYDLFKMACVKYV